MRRRRARRATSAISLASARRPTGLVADEPVDERGDIDARNIGVSTVPGQMALTRTPARAYSTAADLGQPDDAVLRGGVGRHAWRRARSPAVDAQFTIEPPPESTIAGISWRMQENVPVRSTASTRCQFSIVLSAVRLPCSPSMPAALNAASSRPKVRDRARRRRRGRVSSSVTSQRKKRHSPSALELGLRRLARRPVHVGERGARSPGARTPRPRPGRCPMRRR